MDIEMDRVPKTIVVIEGDQMTGAEIPLLPPDALALLEDPRTSSLEVRPEGMPRARCTLSPSIPPQEGESRYLLFRPSLDEASAAQVDWVNCPGPISLGMGKGKGFAGLNERPHFEERRRKPKKLRDAWQYTSWIVASPIFARIVREFEPEVTETVEIDHVYSDGGKLDGYVFLDIKRRLHAYDYSRSDVIVGLRQSGQKWVVGLGKRRGLRQDLEPMHAFLDAHTSDVFMSRELARALIKAGVREVEFLDPATGRVVEF